MIFYISTDIILFYKMGPTVIFTLKGFFVILTNESKLGDNL